MTSPHDQSQYQVRFDWGKHGVATVANDADVIVLVDVFPPSTPESVVFDWPLGVAVVSGSLRNRTAIATWVLARQAEKGDRFSVAVIAAGAVRADGSIRFAVEDQLGAGAIIDALATVGIDYYSPEAAAACVSFTSLRNALGHLVSASASGKDLIERGSGRETELAAEVDSESTVQVLQE